MRRWLAMPVAVPPGVETRPSRTICVCFGVTETAIADAAAGGAVTLPALQQQLKCGTNCGSCVPEVRGLLAARQEAA